jgi:dipeptidyl aminopeptidase/acylaminoacyl peptidase
MNLGFFTASPDGKKLFETGSIWRGEVVVYDRKVHQFLPFLSGIFAAEVDFSRDGKWVAYVTLPEHTLWRSRADGSERLQLTNPPGWPFLPRWSPDGTHIAYTEVASRKTYIVSVQGGTPEEMLSEKGSQIDSHWSPDGKKMVFGRDNFRRDSTESLAIYILDLKSRQLSKITGSDGLYAPRWSPDGQHLAASTSDNKKLLLFDFKTQKWTDWVNETGGLGWTTWSSDGRYIYYQNSKSSSYRRVKLGETHSQLVVDLKDLHQFEFDWAGLTPDGSPLFMRDLSTDEIYSLDVDLP